MRFNPIPLFAILVLLSASSIAQGDKRYELKLNGGTVIPEINISEDSIKTFNNRLTRSLGKAFVVIQFKNIPSQDERKQLANSGIELLEYIPNNSYTALVTGVLDVTLLKKANARAIFQLTPEQKMQPVLARGKIPASAIKKPGTVDVWISFPSSFPWAIIETELKSNGFEIISTELRRYRIFILRTEAVRLRELASFSFVEYVQAAPKEAESLNDKSILNARGNVLQSNLTGERNLRGENITVGVGDDSNPNLHIDFTNRVINRTPAIGGSHGIHVMGTLAGAGIGGERWAGYAPKAKIITQFNSLIWMNAPTYVNDHGMVLTNNSYGIVEDMCESFGFYSLWSRVLDMQAEELPNLQNVFAGGNSGEMSCPPYPTGFGTVLGDFQTAKNVITVGATSETGTLWSRSSKGPVVDGRIKPEITAQGYQVVSTFPTNNYLVSNGTSMAAPAVTGGLALLYQRYRQLNSNADPKNGLMKALLINGAIDKGNPGPDFEFGFGWMNLLRSVTMLEQAAYFNSTVANSVTNQHNIVVPANTAQLKVMLYWNDPAGSLFAPQALVNDLDLEVRDAGNVLTLPQLLDTTKANLGNPATTGVDHINNIEQVIINNPAAGNYNLRVIGTAITQNPSQEYFLVYDAIPVSLQLTYPIGGEHFIPSDSIYITWDAFGNPTNDFTIQYSTDNATWTDIVMNLPAGQNQYKWYMPDTTTNSARVRIIQNGTGLQETSEPFVIVGMPTISFASNNNQCEGYISVNWTSVAGATDYEVMMLRGDEMVPVGTSAGNNFLIKGLSKDSVYWVSVRARISGVPGRRPRAISRQPNTGGCGNTVFNFDLKMDGVAAPLSGRQFTSSELTNATTVSVRVKNLDNSSVANFTVKYSVDGGPFVSEALTSLAGQATLTHDFATPYDFSALGEYLLTVVVENNSAVDPVTINDTVRVLIRHLPNDPITITTSTPFLEDFESATDSTYFRGTVGLEGIERYDFYSTTAFGRVRTFVNSGIAYSGSRALNLDSERYNVGGTADSIEGTFNFQPHFNTFDDVRFDFHYKHHGQYINNPANRVWVRGSDTLPWIEAYDLFANQEDSTGVFKKTTSIELSDLLESNGQDFSSSFQVRLGQYGQHITADNGSAAGYTFDDLRFYIVENDIQLISLDTPVVSSCGLTNAVPITVSVRNGADTTTTNIPVNYTINGGPTITEIIPTISANTTIPYTFAATADLSAFGEYDLIVWVDYDGDSFSENDSLSVTVVNSPIVSSYPYLETFESGDGGWFSDGQNNSWAFGEPNGLLIKTAASGQNAWKTNLAGAYNGNELSYLYSPCFDVSGMSNPQLSFSLALDLEDCGDSELCDGAYVEYSEDGIAWNRLGSKGEGTNWYNKEYTNNHLWSVLNYTRWHVATISLPQGISNLRLRFVLKTDPFVNRDGIAIDDIHIYDSVYSIYEGSPFVSNEVNEPVVNGTGWIDFTDGGELIASINPNGQDLGSTNARVFINTGAVRTNTNQYYHDRNITIKPTNVNLGDSATVRFYFLDTETEALIAATGCLTCTKPGMAYELGVSKYSDIDDSREDGTIANNLPAGWLFIPPGTVSIVPFAKGYYAEFKVRDFSEFWLNHGGLNQDQSLPVELISFTAKKSANNNVIAEWKTSSEENVSHFELQVAKGNTEYEQNNFVTLGQVSSNGNSSTEQRYVFNDLENNKTGVRYYRLKTIDLDGRFSYSVVRPVIFNEEIRWQLFPNPSPGLFNLLFQHTAGDKAGIKVYNANGKMVYSNSLSSTGFLQKHPIDLQSPHFSNGMYLIEVRTGERVEVFRVIKM